MGAIKVADGPNKWDLALALFEGRHTEFLIRGGGKVVGRIKIKILSIELEDGSYNSWNIKGQIVDTNPEIQKIKIEKLYFNTETQTGNITFY
jgi:hypothetical protein